MKKDLFLCYTPLQVLIARSIILSDDYEGGRPECYVFALSDSQRYLHYYHLIEPLCSKSEFVVTFPSFPFYLGWLKKRFSGSGYRNIYIASIDSVWAQFVLSWVGFENIRTFDDGTANILESSKYYRDERGVTSKLKKLIWRVFGNRYSKRRIINESSVHYTLYPTYRNLIDNLRPVFLGFEGRTDGYEKKKEKLVIFVGTVVRDIILNARQQQLLIERVREHYLRQSKHEAVYLPHPRDECDYFPGIPKKNSTLIAEEVVLGYLNKYETIELVAFGSSTQFNLMAHPAVKNVVLDSHLLKPHIRQLIKMLVESGAEHIVLD